MTHYQAVIESHARAPGYNSFIQVDVDGGIEENPAARMLFNEFMYAHKDGHRKYAMNKSFIYVTENLNEFIWLYRQFRVIPKIWIVKNVYEFFTLIRFDYIKGEWPSDLR